MAGSAKKARNTSNQDYVSYLTQSECEQIMSEYLQREHSATEIQLSYRDDGKHRIKYKNSNGSRKSGTFYMNNCAKDQRYCAPVLIPFAHGSSETVSLKSMLEVVSNHWQEASVERWQEASKSDEKKEAKPVSEAEQKRQQALIDEQNRIAQFEAAKKGYQSRLVGTAICQYFYLTAQAHQHPAHHEHQKVKEPNKHPYNVRKHITLNSSDEFLILSSHVPNVNQLVKFINSDKFDMPQNQYGFKAKDVEEKLLSLHKNGEFNIHEYITEHNLKDGIGIIPSHDIHGTVLNLQRIYLKKFDGVDKFNIFNAITHQAMHTFDSQQKVNNPNYQPKHIVLTEGWATGKSINDSIKNNPENMVVVGWTANQLPVIAETLLNHYPNAHLTIAADNDIKSFVNAPEKDANALAVIKNTGLEAAITTYQSSEHKHRISIITPDINYRPPHEVDASKGIKSDFDDIRLSHGKQKLEAELKQQFEAAADRISQGISEADHYIAIYNAQAKHFSDLHLLPLRGIGAKLGDLMFDPLDKSVTLEERKKMREERLATASPAQPASVPVSENEEPPLPAMNYLPIEGLMRVEINPAIKTDYDKKLEQQISLIHRAELGMVASTAQDQAHLKTIDDKRPIPMVDPVLLTTLVYENHLHNHLSHYISNANDRDDIIQKLNQSQTEIDNPSRFISAILDPIMGEHIPKELERVLDQYVNSPIYQSLKEIKAIVSENHINVSAESQNFIQKTQAEIAREVIANNYHKGVDDEITQAIIDKDIIHQDIATKQLFFKELRSCLRSLGQNDEPWLNHVKEMLYESQHLASAFSKPNLVQDTPKPSSDSPSP